MEEERPKLVCSTVTAPYTIPGSVQRDADCGHRVWVSPSGQAHLETNDLEVVCDNCFNILQAGPSAPVPGAVEELKEILGVGGYDQLAAEIRNTTNIEMPT